MAVLAVDLGKTANGGLSPDLAAALAAADPGAPVVVMLHGFRYAPGVAGHCPHHSIFAGQANTGIVADVAGGKAGSRARSVSWPRHLELDRDPGGLALAAGWQARGSFWAARAEAARAGDRLARLIEAICRRRRSPVHLIAHSLGARVALRAMAATGGQIGTAILMNAAATRDEARTALAGAAGPSARVLNVITGANWPFDLGVMALIGPQAGPVLGWGLGAGLAADGAPRNWLDLWIDRPEVQRTLARLGHRIAPADSRVCHWGGYLRGGLFPLYAALMREGGAAHYARLAAHLAISAQRSRPAGPRPGLA